MHFSKTYAQLLNSLPPDLQENSIKYRQLKKLINQIVKELSSLGLSPDLLHELLEVQDAYSFTSSTKDAGSSTSPTSAVLTPPGLGADTTFPRVIYEFGEGSSKLEPRLRILLESLGGLDVILPKRMTGGQGQAGGSDDNKFGDMIVDGEEVEPVETTQDALMPPGNSLLWTLQKAGLGSQPAKDNDPTSKSREVIIPLISDGQFFELLSTALEQMSAHLKNVQSEFLMGLTTLSQTIANSARPASSVLGPSFHPLSPLKDHAGAVRVRGAHLAKSDLYSWREIFQLYVEAEIFESVHEYDRGERSVEESEQRLQLFVQQVNQRGLVTNGKFKLKQSRPALEYFLKLNLFILNIKKFQLANSEATRKILKKHTKRTALPLPSDASSDNTPSRLSLISQVRSLSLPRTLVQGIGETLLPVIPHLDDYSCLICTSIAFKPIRLNCGHLFCVRCLVKMQKRDQKECPMCRAPSVVVADRSNVDWALMNFMQDWFPLEAKEKLKANEKERSDEEQREYGLDPDVPCVVM